MKKFSTWIDDITITEAQHQQKKPRNAPAGPHCDPTDPTAPTAPINPTVSTELTVSTASPNVLTAPTVVSPAAPMEAMPLDPLHSTENDGLKGPSDGKVNVVGAPSSYVKPSPVTRHRSFAADVKWKAYVVLTDFQSVLFGQKTSGPVWFYGGTLDERGQPWARMLGGFCVYPAGYKYKESANYYEGTFPGGNKELNESVYETAMRELFEETGVKSEDPRLANYKLVYLKVSFEAKGFVVITVESQVLNTIYNEVKARLDAAAVLANQWKDCCAGNSFPNAIDPPVRCNELKALNIISIAELRGLLGQDSFTGDKKNLKYLVHALFPGT